MKLGVRRHRVLRGPLVFAAAWLLAVAALGAVGCSSASPSDDAHADAAPSPSDTGRVDASPPAPDAADTDAGPSPESGLTDAGVAPSVDASGPIAATMNDVSILFPLPSSEADIQNLLAPSASGDRGALVPSALYTGAGPITGTTLVENSVELAAYSALRVVALRLDPCFASLAPDPHGVGCTAQLRLVFQEVTWNANGVRAFDSALHAFYTLTRGEFLALAQALVNLRVTNTSGDALGPLAPHPILVRQGLGGAMSKGLQQLVLQYAGAENLSRLAQMSSQTEGITFGGASWTMSVFDVPDGGTTVATPRAIPTLAADGGAVTLQTIGAGSGSPIADPDAGPAFFSASFQPLTTSNDSFAALDDGQPNSVSLPDRQAALDGLVRVENPADNSPNTIDCGSCHLATPSEQSVGMPVFSFNDTTSPLAFVPDGKSVTSADMALVVSEGMFNIHAFSYFDDAPGINQRVVNETAAVVEYLNDLPE